MSYKLPAFHKIYRDDKLFYNNNNWFIKKEGKKWNLYYTLKLNLAEFETKKECIVFVDTLDKINNGEIKRLKNKKVEECIKKIENKFGEVYSTLN